MRLLTMRTMKMLTMLLLGCWVVMSSLSALAQEVVSSKQEKAALKKAKKLRKRLIRGADFASLAKKHSDDPGSGMMGGELGFTGPGQLVPEYEAAATKLSPGELSEPVQTQFGYHLIELIERKGSQINTRHILIKP